MLLAPEWYPDFACIADRCHHSCCIGWEVDVDEDTAELYQQLPGEMGERVRCALCERDGCTSFRMDEHERCVLLNANGLCDLITAFGEGALCSICAEHPRYYADYENFSEVGLGLCCEEAVRLALASPFRMIDLEPEEPGSVTPEEQLLLEHRASLIALAQRDEIPLTDRMAQMAEGLPMPDLTDAAWLHEWKALERLDPEWGHVLDRAAMEQPDAVLLSAQEHDPAWGRLMACLLYRHMPHARETGDMGCEVLLCLHMVRMLRRLAALPGMKLPELVRACSAELEYSDCNMARLRDLLKQCR